MHCWSVLSCLSSMMNCNGVPIQMLKHINKNNLSLNTAYLIFVSIQLHQPGITSIMSYFGRKDNGSIFVPKIKGPFESAHVSSSWSKSRRNSATTTTRSKRTLAPTTTTRVRTTRSVPISSSLSSAQHSKQTTKKKLPKNLNTIFNIKQGGIICNNTVVQTELTPTTVSENARVTVCTFNNEAFVLDKINVYGPHNIIAGNIAWFYNKKILKAVASTVKEGRFVVNAETTISDSVKSLYDAIPTTGDPFHKTRYENMSLSDTIIKLRRNGNHTTE